MALCRIVVCELVVMHCIIHNCVIHSCQISMYLCGSMCEDLYWSPSFYQTKCFWYFNDALYCEHCHLHVLIVLIYDHICCSAFSDSGWDYLSFRLWTGLWISLALMIMVMFDLSALVRYITRFTEESFAMLIALIFIYEAFKKLLHIAEEHPVNFRPDEILDYSCSCIPGNDTDGMTTASMCLTWF